MHLLMYLLVHKWYVLVAGVRLGVPFWQLIIHDWTRFRRDEWFVNLPVFSTNGEWRHDPAITADVQDAAWLHAKRNPHHWEHWHARRIPDRYAREMIADWYGANRAKRIRFIAAWMGRTPPPPLNEWYEQVKQDIAIHPETRLFVEHMFSSLPWLSQIT